MGAAARYAAMAALLLGSTGRAAACGAGELAIPDTVGCVRLGGVARAEVGGRAGRAASIAPPSSDGGRTAARLWAGARADLDARVPTASGPIRAYLSVGTGGYGRR